jgi:hypothetical protein
MPLGVPFYGCGWMGGLSDFNHGLCQLAERPSAEGGNACKALSQQGYPEYRDGQTGWFWYFDDVSKRFAPSMILLDGLCPCPSLARGDDLVDGLRSRAKYTDAGERRWAGFAPYGRLAGINRGLVPGIEGRTSYIRRIPSRSRESLRNSLPSSCIRDPPSMGDSW